MASFATAVAAIVAAVISMGLGRDCFPSKSSFQATDPKQEYQFTWPS